MKFSVAHILFLLPLSSHCGESTANRLVFDITMQHLIKHKLLDQKIFYEAIQYKRRKYAADRKEGLVLALQLHEYSSLIVNFMATHFLKNPPLDLVFLESDQTFHDACMQQFGLQNRTAESWQTFTRNLKKKLKDHAYEHAPIYVLPTRNQEPHYVAQSSFQGHWIITKVIYEKPYNALQKNNVVFCISNDNELDRYHFLVPKNLQKHNFLIEIYDDTMVYFRFRKKGTNPVCYCYDLEKVRPSELQSLETLLLRTYCFKNNKSLFSIQKECPELQPLLDEPVEINCVSNCVELLSKILTSPGLTKDKSILKSKRTVWHYNVGKYNTNSKATNH